MQGGFLGLFYCGFARKNLFVSFGGEFEFAPVGEKSVLLLFNVCKLSVAEGENFFVIEKNICKTAKAREKVFFALNALTVAPGGFAAVHNPAYAAVFAYENGKIGFIELSALVHSVELIVYNALIHTRVIEA